MTATAVRAVSEEDVSGGAQNGANYGGPVFVLRLVQGPWTLHGCTHPSSRIVYHHLLPVEKDLMSKKKS